MSKSPGGAFALGIMAAGVLYGAIPTAAQSAVQPVRFVTEFRNSEREYFLYLPTPFDSTAEYPLIVMVHGAGGNGSTFAMSRMAAAAAAEVGFPAIVLSPSFPNDDHNPSRFPALGEGEFLRKVIAEIRHGHKVKTKIFLAGYSRGGQFAHRFALTHPEMVQAVAAFASGTWTTPDGRFFVEEYGEVKNPQLFLTNPNNAAALPESRRDLFTSAVARVAADKAAAGAVAVPFLVMCGTLDPRLPIAEQFVGVLQDLGYSVTTEWPRTPHACSDEACRAEFGQAFARYPQAAITFFIKHANRS